MGPSAKDPCKEPLVAVTHRLLTKAGFVPIHLPNEPQLCCGLPFESKGLKEQADVKTVELEQALLAATERGRYPVLCDTSPCIERMRRTLTPQLRLYEPVEFLHRFLLPRLKISKYRHPVAVHVTCSARKMGLTEIFHWVADALAEQTLFPDRVDCCGFAGDRGFSHPELNRSALTHLKPAVAGTCKQGYSNSRTCEIGLSHHSSIPYRSIFYLADSCSLDGKK
jgi:D-lactate dehydrogenase